MVSVLGSGSCGPGSSPGQGHCVVFLGMTLCSHSVSSSPGVLEGIANLMLGIAPCWTSIPSRGSRNTRYRFMLQKWR